jgi:hypothetical protein
VSQRVGRYRRPSAAEEDDLRQALDALSAADLRTAVRGILDELDDPPRAAIVDRLVARAAKGVTGWTPARPSRRIVEDAQSFADAARRLGHADAEDVTEHLRRATRAFLAGDHSTARAVFDAILPPIARVEIDLGQHELVEEVLGIDAHVCVAQYAASVYTSTPMRDRAAAILRTIEDVEGVATLADPVKAMEGVTAGALPDLDAFLPLWVKRLQRLPPSSDEWETPHERWLRDAIFRMEGVDGLERLARKTRRPQACLAWCDALADRKDWPAALRAAVAAARLVRQSHWRGRLLDGAALAAQELGRSDLPKRLEAAWKATPTLPRLLRWLAAGDARGESLRNKATRAMACCPKVSARQIGLLRLLLDDMPGAAALLASAPGLGWSNPDHPGHTLFPLFAMLLSRGTIGDALLEEMNATGCEPLDIVFEADEGQRPRLATPSLVAVIQSARSGRVLPDTDGDAAIDAMRVAAEKRVEGILGHSRRQHYGHAALLVASCLAFAPKRREPEFSKWVADLQQQYSRRSAFRAELAQARASLGLT